MTTMTTALTVKELEDAIIANPDSDELRHQIAERLRSLHNERGDFIARQMEIYRYIKRRRELPPVEMEKGQKRLLDAGFGLWARGLGNAVRMYHYRRGFAEEIDVEARRFIARAESIVRMAPVRHVRLFEAAPHMNEVASVPQLAQMISLELRENDIGDAGCRAIAGSPYLGKLRWLGLGTNGITEAGVEALARSENLPSLQFVDLMYNDTEEPAPIPTGIDHDGSYHDVEKTALHRRLVAAVGPKPWLTTAWQGLPDKDAV